jgi:lysophospholipase L1-like esterase
MLFAAEMALQARAQMRYGSSIFSAGEGESKYVHNEALGLRTLRPMSVIKGAEQTIESNRHGLRGEDFESEKPAAELRIAQLGASTIQGAYARTNNETSSALLQDKLRASISNRQLRVINAGLDGTTLSGQARLLDWLVTNLGVEQVLWYPGTNDISCRKVNRSNSQLPPRFPWPGLPRWTLTNDLIVMNTAALRKSRAPSNQNMTKDFDLEGMKASVEVGIRSARHHGISLVLVTSATSYRSTMPADEITRRADSALFFRPCYTGPELARSVALFNDMLREVAVATNVPIIDAERLMPSDLALFGDASHFSPEGEARFAELMATQLLSGKLVAPGDAL